MGLCSPLVSGQGRSDSGIDVGERALQEQGSGGEVLCEVEMGGVPGVERQKACCCRVHRCIYCVQGLSEVCNAYILVHNSGFLKRVIDSN